MSSRISMLVGGTLALMLVTAAVLIGQSQARVDQVSNSGFADTSAKLDRALKSRGMMVVATIDHQNMLRMVGGSIKGSKTIEFGKPDMMKMLLPGNPEVGLEMPLRIYVFERADGKTVLSYYRPSNGFASYGKEPISGAGQMMDQMLNEIVAEAIKRSRKNKYSQYGALITL